MKTPTYTVKLYEIVEGLVDFSTTPQSLECSFNANSDEVAAQIMSDLTVSFIRHNHLHSDQVNANLYRTQWINGI